MLLPQGRCSTPSAPETIDRLRTKVGELTMDTELLYAKIGRREGWRRPFHDMRTSVGAVSARTR